VRPANIRQGRDLAKLPFSTPESVGDSMLLYPQFAPSGNRLKEALKAAVLHGSLY